MPPQHWPSESRIARTPGLPTLVMLAHPHCPCSRASVEELDRLMAQADGAVSAHVLFVKPDGVPDDWEQSDLWTRAVAIPGVHARRDDLGGEAERFGAATSGQVVLYDGVGELLFSGGITSARGHSGDNAGRDSVLSLLTSGRADRDSTPVFGCPLHEARAAGTDHGS
jgi:hypothetical protein